ncbi:hypothetical protein PFTANZ_06563 [Plasmodium falciparum Tanzania (2000708)]|uniref:Duffy-binding-like domain-containing protein n=1 Tax=Plasmodium falciparum Tanzania (2000708) TaxID=1036725 RepID=A0A024VWM0_PLAFA|nr:hypothetical protein PFTANZ_06563 [Plasmodium falciparum Tanzania (2000708)]
MGSQSSKSSQPSVVTNESEKSARNVLDVLAEDIKKQAENKAQKHARSLKGKLSQAKFHQPLLKATNYVWYVPSNPCELDYIFHTNVHNSIREDRCPCLLRDKKRFSNEGEAECGSDKIRDNGERSAGGACAPYRRRHLCDYNLEFINEQNVLTTHDLLGNVLVTAKYEGQSIVNNHPHKETSDVCTALARSFADIGDIIRGKDMFKPNDKVEKGLREVFRKINDDLKKSKITDYDNDPNYYKLREAWWTANRDQVWKALTCTAPDNVNYFRKYSDGSSNFSSEGKCGHKEGTVPTYLDYVPQFLRWFNEWADDFCRIKKIKLELAKDTCRNDKERKYCSYNGYDCKNTIWRKRIFQWDNKCTDCSAKCKLYEHWLDNQEKEFEKQKQKYEKEIQTYLSEENKPGSNIKNEYYKQFYNKLKGKYETVNEFIKLLNEGKYCKEKLPGKEIIDFTNIGEKGTFYRSEYCQPCPECGVECTGGTCKPKDKDNYCEHDEEYDIPNDVQPIDITVLYSGNEQGDITKKLEEFCNISTKYEGKNYENWQCYYKNKNKNKCKMEPNSKKDKDKPKITKFHNFFEFWVTYLLTDTILWNDKFKTCMNNTNITDCSDGCNKHCVCFDKWVKQKEQEWNKIKELLTKEQNMVQQYYHKINYHFQGYFFHVMDKLNHDEAKWKELTQELKKKIDSSKGNEGTKDSQDAIKVLLDYLKEKSTICKDNNTIEACSSNMNPQKNPCANNSTTTTGGDNKHATVKQIAQYLKRKAYYEANKRSDGLHKLKGKAHEGIYKRGAKKNDFKDNLCRIMIKHSNQKKEDHVYSGKKKPCDIVEEHFKLKDNKTGGIEKCNPKDYGGTYPGWNCTNETLVSGKGECMPPRRQKLCLINLQYFTGKTTVDLREAFIKCAAVETFFLWHKYKDDKEKVNPSKNVDKEVQKKLESGEIPEDFKRQMFYTFGDYRDIFFDTDISKKQGPVKDAIDNIGKVFEKEKISEAKKDGKTDDKEREKFWKENGKEIWEGMLCGLSHASGNKETVQKTLTTNYTYPNVKFSGDNTTSLEEFAQTPQFLRWFTEWADQFCTERGVKIEELEAGCMGYKCNNGDNEEQKKKCANACKKYQEWLKKWRENYDKQKDKFKGDKNSGTYSNDPVSNKSEDARDYLDKTLEKICSDKNGDCEYNCMKKKSTQSLDGNTDSMPASLDDEPEEVQGKCSCKPPPKKPEVPPAKVPSACEIVKRILRGKTEKTTIGNCKGKYEGRKYPEWNCNTEIHTKHIGACMPPRRQKLCIHFLAHNTERPYIKTQDKLREAFIKSAAGETFFSWYKYKNDNNTVTNIQNQLKKGEIPEEFKRQMFYTFGDYRDFLFGTDISKNHGIGSELEKQINSLFQNNYGKTTNGKTREQWWTDHGPEVWEAMLCALEHFGAKNEILTKNYEYNNVKFSDKTNTTLSTFSQTPQFLRWMIEWSEHFCKEQKKKYTQLVTGCNGYECNGENGKDDNKEKCRKACEAYKELIEKWKKQWIEQSEKYNKLYTQGTTNGVYGDVDEKEKKLLEYFKKLNEPNGTTYSTAGKYINKKGYIEDCQESKQNNFDKNSSSDNEKEYALRNYPNDYETQCTCKTEESTPPPVQPPQPPLPPLPPLAPPPQSPRLPAAGGSRHDHRARSEGGGQGPLPGPRSPPKSKPTGVPGGVGRSLPRRDNAENDDNEDEESEEESEESEEESETPVPSATPVPPAPAGPPATTTTPTVVDVCTTVKSALTGSLQDACRQKYSEPNRYWGWKCITSGKPGDTTSGDQKATPPSNSGDSTTTGKDGATGGLCIPPRRRRLYVTPLTKWAAEEATKSQSQETSGKVSSQSGEKLRTAFIQSAAIETFFLWHKYKVDKEKEKKEKNRADEIVARTPTEDPEQKELEQSGEIPDEFKRQMFYTLGDYRDLCVGVKDDDVIKALEASGDNNIETIQKKIKEILNGNNKKTADVQNSEKLKSWWEQHAESIWNGMVCALTYKEDTSGTAEGGKIQQNSGLKKAFFGKDDKPDNTPKGNSGTFQSTYDYTTVTFKGGFNSDKTSTINNTTTKLTDFVKRPPFFRWLEEWGEEFCRKQKHKLEIIRVDCRGKNGGKVCSGDGENCETIRTQDYDTISDFDCPSCGKSCGLYKRWIERKKDEFIEQQNAFTKQKDKCVNGSTGAESKHHSTCDQNFVENLRNGYQSIDSFLQKLVSCSKNENEEDNKKIFKDIDKTFGHENYCDPCSQFKIKCENCNSSGDTKVNCNGKTTIDATDIEEKTDANGKIEMLVSDKGESGFKGDLSVCEGAGIFKGIKENKYKCGEYCGVDICKKKNVNGNKNVKEYIQIRALLKRWVEYFIQDYNKIKEKLKPCIENGEKPKCENKCEQKCKCVDKWIKKKKLEWKEIKNRYLEQYKNSESGDSFSVKLILEDLQSQIDFKSAIKPCGDLTQFEKSKQCNAAANTENGQKTDIVECLLDKLKKKIETFQSQHQNSGENTAQCAEYTPPDDDDPLEEEENTVAQPNICPPTPAETVDEDACKPEGIVKEEEEEKEEEKDKETLASGEEEEEEEEEDDEEEEELDSDTYEDDSDSKTEDEDEDEAVTHTSSPSEPQPKGLPREFPSTQLKNAMLFSTILWMIYNQRNHNSTTPHHPPNTRLLCECELYSPATYDDDPQMKSVIDNFNKQTQQRLHEYDERMKTTRQKCKEQCDKDIQKIILKDKLEKELMDKFATLQTDIQNDAIPTCVCEKSLGDKVEKGCLRCGGLLGGGIAPGWGLVSGLGYVGWTNYVTQTALQKGIEAGVKYGIQELKGFPGLCQLIKVSQIQSFINHANYAKETTYFNFIKQVKTTKCVDEAARTQTFCNYSPISNDNGISQRASQIAKDAVTMAKIAETKALEEAAPVTSGLNTAIIASIVAILVIVLVMIIIYLVLRYRRKKKMKKKLQYIKLLKE